MIKMMSGIIRWGTEYFLNKLLAIQLDIYKDMQQTRY